MRLESADFGLAAGRGKAVIGKNVANFLSGGFRLILIYRRIPVGLRTWSQMPSSTSLILRNLRAAVKAAPVRPPYLKVHSLICPASPGNTFLERTKAAQT